MTLVVSEDGPMSVFEKGHVLNMRHEPKDVEDREVLAVGASRYASQWKLLRATSDFGLDWRF